MRESDRTYTYKHYLSRHLRDGHLVLATWTPTRSSARTVLIQRFFFFAPYLTLVDCALLARICTQETVFVEEGILRAHTTYMLVCVCVYQKKRIVDTDHT